MEHFTGMTRDALSEGTLRAALRSEGGAGSTWSDAQIRQSLAETLALAPGKDIWVFAYGSLIWNPIFPVADARRALVHGFHRSFCLSACVGRGTPARPGLMLGLDAGGSCAGIALKIGGPDIATELDLLWQREMLPGLYRPRWTRARSPQGSVMAVTFVANRTGPHYRGSVREAEAAAIIGGASGLLGSNLDYLARTDRGLVENGIVDPHLSRLLRLSRENA